MDAYEALHESIQGIVDVPLEDFKQMLVDWDIVDCDGAAVMIKGNEIHCGSSLMKRGKWLSRRLIKKTFVPLFNKYGYIQTHVELPNADGHAFVRRLGFRETLRDNTFIFYELRRECVKHI